MKYTWLEVIVIVAIVLLGAALVSTAFSGCSLPKAPKISDVLGGGDVPLSGARASVAAVYRTNWALSVAVIGVTASVFAICMGLRKLGAAGLAASFTMAAMSIAMIRFAWIFGIGGLLIGIGTGLAALVKNRQTIFGFVDGFQEVKKEWGKQDSDKDSVNAAMGGKLNPIAECMVKARKKALAKVKKCTT